MILLHITSIFLVGVIFAFFNVFIILFISKSAIKNNSIDKIVKKSSNNNNTLNIIFNNIIMPIIETFILVFIIKNSFLKDKPNYLLYIITFVVFYVLHYHKSWVSLVVSLFFIVQIFEYNYIYKIYNGNIAFISVFFTHAIYNFTLIIIQRFVQFVIRKKELVSR